MPNCKGDKKAGWLEDDEDSQWVVQRGVNGGLNGMGRDNCLV